MQIKLEIYLRIVSIFILAQELWWIYCYVLTNLLKAYIPEKDRNDWTMILSILDAILMVR